MATPTTKLRNNLHVTGSITADNGVSGALAAPTPTVRGGVLQQAAIPNIGAAPTQADFNGLLAALRAAGVVAP